LECGTTAQDLDVHLVADLTDEHRLGGRVTVGHMAKLSLMPVAEMAKVAQRIADVGVAVTVLPATDLFLMGKAADRKLEVTEYLGQWPTSHLSSSVVFKLFEPLSGPLQFVSCEKTAPGLAQRQCFHRQVKTF
jgi:hypothetical protein